MLRYMRSSEPKGSSPAAPATSASPNTVVQTGAPQPHPIQASSAPPPLSTRQQLAEAAKIPLPMRSSTPSHQASALSAISPPRQKLFQQQQQQQPPRSQRRPSLQHSRSNSENSNNINNGGSYPQQSTLDQAQQQQIWEESSINSMFAESVATAARPPRAIPSRYESPFPANRSKHSYDRSEHDRAPGANEVTAPLLVSDRGILRILPTSGGNSHTPTPADDPYVEASPYGGSPSRKIPVLKHSKYALRDTRAATHRSSFTDRVVHGNHDEAAVADSPERTPIKTERGPKAADPSRGVDQSPYYHSDRPLGRTPTRSETATFHSEAEEGAHQRTPRPLRSPTRQPPQGPPPPVRQKRLQESSLPRVGGTTGGGGGSRREKKMSRKRQLSPDYDDSHLHSMSYSDLRNEPFDHDPARAAVNAAAAGTPPQMSVEDQLTHYKTKDANNQHQFFTEMSAQEWDECGDWFLAQFADLTNKIRQARQAKRKKVADFEAEIAEREKLVRVKTESIERTLDDLKHDGEGMMRGRSVGG